METGLKQSDQRFVRTFHLFNLCWLGLAFVSLIWSATGAIIEQPGYLHDWHGIAIAGLILLVLTPYSLSILPARRRGRENWPPPLKHSLPLTSELYLCTTLLSMLNGNFLWSYFLVAGMAMSQFSGKRLLAVITVIFLSSCIVEGYPDWSLTESYIGGILGLGIAYFSITVMSLSLQHLIGERYARSQLLQQLTQSNQELAEAHRQLAATAAQEQELAVLRERTRLAREMHDTLGHALVLVSVKLEAAQRLRERDPERCEQELEGTKEIVRTSMKDLRASIANLRSPALEREPACRALSRHARDMAQRANLRVSYDLHPNIEGLPESVEETLWKVGQEALTNIEKHAHAQNVLLHISCENSHILLKIEDDGIGLPLELYQSCAAGSIEYKSPEGHYGLSGIQERIRNNHGQLAIHSTPGLGTSLEISISLIETHS